MNPTQLDEPRIGAAALTSAPRAGAWTDPVPDAVTCPLGLPLVVLPWDFTCRPGPGALVPQDATGSVLIALEPPGAEEPREASGRTVLIFEPSARAWNRAALTHEAELAGGRRPLAAVRSGWTFRVPADGRTHPFALGDLAHCAPEALGVDQATGVFTLTGEDGSVSGFYRLRPKRAARAHGVRHGAELEVVQVRRDAHGRLPRVHPGASLAAHWASVATFEGNERWLYVNVREPALAFALSGPDRR